ncbi:MAG: response regulator [Bacteroidota bacterium]|nr:response regulator [Bacteroidota bacterium]
MEKKQLIIRIALASAFVWIIHSIILAVFSAEDDFFGMFISNVSPADLVFRLVLIVGIVSFGFYLNKVLGASQGNTEMIEVDIPEGIKKIADSDPNFLNNFLHKIRTQLNNIFGFADLLRDKGTKNEEVDRYFGYIESSKQSINAAVDELVSVLKMGKIQTWKKGDDYLEIINWKGKKILIAEDVETNFILLKAVLEKTGAEIIWAQNGMEAVKICRTDRDIDLILMDILMPEMDGFEATKAIRKFHSTVPIIAQTAYNFDWNAIQKEGLGFNDYLAKPIGHYDLILKSYRYLES